MFTASGGPDSVGRPSDVIVADMTQVLADGYRRFAELEAAGISEIYFDWATGIADDPAVLHMIAALPGIKRQPNLVFAAARFLGAPAGRYADFRDWLIEHSEVVTPAIRSPARRANGPARCGPPQAVTTCAVPSGASGPISAAMRFASSMRVATISASGTVLMT